MGGFVYPSPGPMWSSRAILLSLAVLSGCAWVSPPPGQENQTTFVQETPVPYKEAYTLLAKQIRACYRVIGVFGNGYDVQADLDSANQSGRIEVYHVGLSGASKPDDSSFSRTVTVGARQGGSTITTTGTTPAVAYTTHLAVAGWLKGNDSCGTRR